MSKGEEVIGTTHMKDEIRNNESEKLVIIEGQVSNVAQIEDCSKPFSKRWEHFGA